MKSQLKGKPHDRLHLYTSSPKSHSNFLGNQTQNYWMEEKASRILTGFGLVSNQTKPRSWSSIESMLHFSALAHKCQQKAHSFQFAFQSQLPSLIYLFVCLLSQRRTTSKRHHFTSRLVVPLVFSWAWQFFRLFPEKISEKVVKFGFW